MILLASKKNRIIEVDSFDSKVIYFAIIAIAITNFIVRLKIIKNIRGFDMSMIPVMSNLFTYYKLVWILNISLILAIILLYRMHKYKQKLELNFVLLGTGLIIIAAMVSFILDPIQEVTIWGLYSRSNGLLAYVCLFLFIFMISNLKFQSKHISILVHATNIFSVLIVIIGIFQFFGLDLMNSLWFKQIYVPSEYKHIIENLDIIRRNFKSTEYYWASSILGQFNYFGAYCSIIFPLVTVFALNEDNIIKKTLLATGSVVLFTGTILAQSIGSIFTLYLVLILIPIFLVNRKNYKGFILMSISYAIISSVINRLTDWWAFLEIYRLTLQILNSKLVLLLIFLAIIYILLLILRKRIFKYRYLLVSILIISILVTGAIGYIFVLNNVVEQNMRMLSSRGYIWHYSNELIKDNYIFGYGPDNLYYNFPQMNPHKEQFMPGVVVDKPHNMYLQVLLDTGIFGLIGFMTILVGLLLKSNKAIDLETDLYKNTYFKALMLVIAAYMIQGIVNDNHLTIQPTVYLIMGIGASLIKQTLDKAKLSSTTK
jgi:hypothetical protein